MYKRSHNQNIWIIIQPVTIASLVDVHSVGNGRLDKWTERASVWMKLKNLGISPTFCIKVVMIMQPFHIYVINKSTRMASW